MFFFFFFFQAEDGIRDHCVTGVQTCALPICRGDFIQHGVGVALTPVALIDQCHDGGESGGRSRGATGATKTDRKSTRLNSSHTVISYAVFCLKKKKGNSEDNNTSAATRVRRK